MYAVNTVSHSSVEVRSLKSRLLVRNNKRLLQISAAVHGRLNNRKKKKFADCVGGGGGHGPTCITGDYWYLVWCQTVAGVSLDAAHKL